MVVEARGEGAVGVGVAGDEFVGGEAAEVLGLELVVDVFGFEVIFSVAKGAAGSLDAVV